MLEHWQKQYPHKFVSTDDIFKNIHAGDRIFISTGCGEPQYLVNQLAAYVEAHPKAFFDAEVLQVWTLGVAPYTDEKLKHNFRHNSFFISHHTR
ncbi:MAG: acetyl-CoA hydrolase, partial [Dethiobacteria bacterium]